MDYKLVSTTCPYCGCGCGFFLEVFDGKLIGTLPNKTAPVNEGKLCIKGWNAHEFVVSPQRLTRPLIRRGSELEPASWEEALDLTASRLKSVKEQFGPDSIAFLTSAKCTNEENYLLQKFARAGVGTNNIDHCARLWHSSTVAGLAASFGSGAMTNSIAEIENADCIFIIGSNTSVAHPLIAARVFRAKARGAKVMVADPRRIPITAQADLFVQQQSGTDVALINGMMHLILKNNWQNQAFIDERTENFEAVRAVVEQYPPEKVADLTGVSVEALEKMAEWYARSEKSTILYTMGITQHITGVDNVKTLANLAMLCGQIGRESTGVNPLRGQNNVQGACDMGGLPNVYPAYQPVTDLNARKRFMEAWQVESLSDKVGLTIMEIMRGIEEGSIKALVILGENPLLSDPDSNHVEKALKAVEFLAVIDIFPTETAQIAQVVLPGAAFAEKDGTFANTERRVQRIRKAVDPPGEARPDWWIIQELSTRFGYPLHYESPGEIQEEIRKVTPSYGGISYDRLEGEGLIWPCPTLDHEGTRFLHKDRFARGKGLFQAVEYKEPAEVPDADYPLWLTTGRFSMHYHTGTMTRRSPTLEKEGPEQVAEIHPQDARVLGLKEGDLARVSSRRGEILSKVTLTDRVRPGLIFLSFHYQESNVNKLTNTALDPIAKIPEFKVCAVKVEKAA